MSLSSASSSSLAGRRSSSLSHTPRILLNALAVNVGWFACVLGAAGGVPWVGPAVVAGLVAIHGLINRPDAGEWKLLGTMAFLGFGVDSALGAAGVFQYSSGLAGTGWLAPLWLIALWVNLGTAVNHCLGWLAGKPWLAANLGALGGAGAYVGGSRLGAMELGYSLPAALLVLAAVWAVVFPAIYRLNARLHG